MINNSHEWSAKATAWATQHMLGARHQGLEVAKMPPHLTLLAFEDDLILMEDPRIIDDESPSFWGLLTQSWLEENRRYQGFVLWCIVGSGVEDEGAKGDQACVITWKKGDSRPLCVLMSLDFNPDKFKVIEVSEVLEGFDIDFNEPPLAH